MPPSAIDGSSGICCCRSSPQVELMLIHMATSYVSTSLHALHLQVHHHCSSDASAHHDCFCLDNAHRESLCRSLLIQLPASVCQSAGSSAKVAPSIVGVPTAALLGAIGRSTPIAVAPIAPLLDSIAAISSLLSTILRGIPTAIGSTSSIPCRRQCLPRSLLHQSAPLCFPSVCRACSPATSASREAFTHDHALSLRQTRAHGSGIVMGEMRWTRTLAAKAACASGRRVAAVGRGLVLWLPICSMAPLVALIAAAAVPSLVAACAAPRSSQHTSDLAALSC